MDLTLVGQVDPVLLFVYIRTDVMYSNMCIDMFVYMCHVNINKTIYIQMLSDLHAHICPCIYIHTYTCTHINTYTTYQG